MKKNVLFPLLARVLGLGLLVVPLLSACEKDDSAESVALLEAYRLHALATQKTDSSTIAKYVADSTKAGNAFAKARRLPSGVVVAPVSTAGNTQLPTTGQIVNITYRGTLLDQQGTQFDRSAVGGSYSFTLGVSRVIAGWHLGIATLHVGDKAILLIPSGLAYGPTGQNEIMPDTPLRFDVELIEIKE